MSVVIYKYKLSPEFGAQKLKMPEGASLLKVADFQDNDLVVWAMVDTNKPEVENEVLVAPTGQPLAGLITGQAAIVHLATAQRKVAGEFLVCHIFVLQRAETKSPIIGAVA